MRACGRPGIHVPVLLLSLLTLAHCGSSPRTLQGFPMHRMERGTEGIAESADALLDDLSRMERAIEATAPAESDAQPLRTAALRALLAAQLSISAEALSYQEPPQLQEPAYPPIVLHPRLTAPALVEPSLVETPDGRRLCWIVPVLFDKGALWWDLSEETVWFGRSRRRHLYNEPTGHVAGFLVRHGETRIEARRPVDAARFLHVPAPLDVTLTDGSTVSLPDMLPARAGAALAIPVDDEVRPGFYDIQLFPRLPIDAGAMQTEWARRVAYPLAFGDWYRALEEVRRFPGALRAGGLRAVERDLAGLAASMEAYGPTRFDGQLEPIRHAVLRWSWRAPDPAFAAAPAPEEVIRRLESFVRRSHQPIPVLLDEPGRSTEPFSFVAAGDLQFHDDRKHLDRFLRLIGADGRRGASAQLQALPPDVQARLREIKFVVIAGDLGDGEGLSSKTSTTIAAGLGVVPPLSPYEKEFPIVRNELEHCRVPVFAVPGNHDGFAAYGGLLNSAFDIAGEILKAPPDPIRPLTHPLGHGLQEIGQYLPTLVKVGRLSRHPYFDGLVEWQFAFGPLNSAFTYRGCSFIAFNSYHLPALYRDQVGPIANNWGGGVEPADALWFDVVARWQQRQAAQGAEGRWQGHQFVFMHHDPRAAIPDPKGSGKEIGYGEYDGPDAPFNALTFGWVGTDYSTLNPLFLPIITPVGSNLWRLAHTGDRFNQEWMGTQWGSDRHCNNARPLVDSMSANLAREHGGGGISHVFFAHNDEPAEGTWGETEGRRRVFRPPPGREWTGCPYGSMSALEPFAKIRTREPFDWGRDARVPQGRNAEVHRVDDLGDNGSEKHGFHLVTVYPNPGGPPAVQVTPVPILPDPQPPSVR